MKLVTTKNMSSLLCMFLMTRSSGKYFYNTKIFGIFFHQSWALWALSVKIVYGTIPTRCKVMHAPNMIIVWHNNLALWHYEVGRVLTHGFWGWDMEWDRTLPACLLDAADFSDTRSSPVEASRQSKFISNKLLNWPILLNLASKTD